jgi:hypothetical protein
MKKRKLVAALVASGVAPALFGVIAGGAATHGSVTVGGAVLTGEAAYKASVYGDTDPHLPLTPYQQQMLSRKVNAVSTVMSGTASPSSISASIGATGSTVTPTATVVASSMPADFNVPKDQTPQKTSYYCGPATAREALGQMGKWFTQDQLASWLGTTTAGTAWSGGPTATGHPMPDVVNAHQSKNYYIPQAVNGPTSTELSNYKSELEFDIWAMEVPLVGDAWEVNGGQFHLVSHPTDRTIFHWFDIYGYHINSGTVYTKYEDSVHGVPPSVIPWAPNVPAYSSIPSNQIAHIVAGRGYVW